MSRTTLKSIAADRQPWPSLGLESPTTERHDKLYFWDENARRLSTLTPAIASRRPSRTAGLPASLPTPDWVKNGFPNGAVRIANTPGFQRTYGQTVNSHQFAPRIGIAYQNHAEDGLSADPIGLFYLSTTATPTALAAAAWVSLSPIRLPRPPAAGTPATTASVT